MSVNKTDKQNKSRSALCSSVQAKLLSYADFGLSTQDRAVVDTHLSGCEECASELVQIQRAESALAAARHAIPAPGDLYAGFAAKLESQNAHRINPWRYAAPALAFATIALIIVAVEHKPKTSGFPVTPDLRGDLSANTASRLPVPAPTSDPRFGFEPPNKSTSQIKDLALQRHSERQLDAIAVNGRSSYGVRIKRATQAPLGRIAFYAVNIQSKKRVQLTSVDNYLVLNDMPVRQNISYRYDAEVESRQISQSVVANRDDQLSDNRLSYFTPLYSRTLSISPQQNGRGGIDWAAATQAQQPTVGFALYVEDDVRGFSSEAHDSVSEATQAKSTVDAGDEVKVEVEFDDSPAL